MDSDEERIILLNKICDRRRYLSALLLMYVNGDISFREIITEIKEMTALLEQWEVMRMGNNENTV